MSDSTERAVAKYRRTGTDDDGDPTVYRKWIVVRHDESEDETAGDLTVTFAASDDHDVDPAQVPDCLDDYENIDWNGNGSGKKTFEWSRFLEVMNGIEARMGHEFVANVFVGGVSGPAAVGRQTPIVDEYPTVAGLESRANEDGDLLHLYYDTTDSPEKELLTMRWVWSGSDDNIPDRRGSPAGDFHPWQVQDHELQQLLVEDPDTDASTEASEGFSREFREALFLNPRRHRVVDML